MTIGKCRSPECLQNCVCTSKMISALDAAGMFLQWGPFCTCRLRRELPVGLSPYKEGRESGLNQYFIYLGL